MKILKLLNRKYLSIILIFFISFNTQAEDKPIDIWNIDKKKLKKLNLIKSNKKKLMKKSNLVFMICNLKKKLIQFK